MSARLATLLVAAALVWSAGATAADSADERYRVRAFVQPESGVTDARPFQLVIQIEGSTSPQVEAPALADVPGASLLAGPNTSSRFFWSNGRATSSYQISYQLLADKPGVLEIPSLTLRIDGSTYRTQPVRVEVSRGRDGSRGVTPGGALSPPGGRADPVFLEIELGADEVWVGQPVPLTVTLYTRLRVAQVGWRSQPSFSNFWVETVDVDPEAESYRKKVGDQVYTAYPVVRRMLVPPSAGEFTIEPYVAQMQVRSGSGDVFDLFSFGRTETIVRKTPELELRVKQLPAGEPPGFSGAVGRFTLGVSLDRTRSTVDDAVALRASVEGDGSLHSVEPPVFDPPPDVKIFEPKVTETSSRMNGGMRSSKTWEWILVPLKPGELHLPEVRFPYFDPETATYRLAARTPPTLLVERSTAPSDRPVARSEIRMQRDLAYIKPLRGSLQHRHARAHERGLFQVLVVLPLALVPLTILLGRRQARLRQDRGLSRARSARSRARKRLRGVRRKLGQADSAVFHEELARTLVDYVADHFNRSAAGMTYEEADDLLASRGVEPELRRRFRTCLETCDFARFVPAAAEQRRRAEVLEEAGRLVEELERAW